MDSFQSNSTVVDIYPQSLTVNDEMWTECPVLDEVLFALGRPESRLVKNARALPRIVVDGIGLALRYSESNHKVHSLLIYYNVMPSPESPNHSFSGRLLIGGDKVNHPPKISDIRQNKYFTFDNRPESVAIGSLISMRLIAVSNSLAILDVGWEDFVRYGWG